MREAAREQRVRLVAVLEGGEVEECAVIEVQLDRVGDQAEDGVAAALVCWWFSGWFILRFQFRWWWW